MMRCTFECAGAAGGEAEKLVHALEGARNCVRAVASLQRCDPSCAVEGVRKAVAARVAAIWHKDPTESVESRSPLSQM
eukprot:41819-Eustigmatos_ZCMA.PRE.1